MQHAGFNPKSRWDRRVPASGERYEYGYLNEYIEVFAWFIKGKAFPRLFLLGGKKYKIKKITYSWQERNGRELINRFTVSTLSNLYQISFSSLSLAWKLDKIVD